MHNIVSHYSALRVTKKRNTFPQIENVSLIKYIATYFTSKDFM